MGGGGPEISSMEAPGVPRLVSFFIFVYHYRKDAYTSLMKIVRKSLGPRQPLRDIENSSTKTADHQVWGKMGSLMSTSKPEKAKPNMKAQLTQQVSRCDIYTTPSAHSGT